MIAQALLTIDWQAPWFKPFEPWGAEVLARWSMGQSLSQALNGAAQNAGLHSSAALPVSFVPQEALPKGVAYETFIEQTAQVPTREHPHDFFNAMSWCRTPHTKAFIGAAQAQAIERQQAACLTSAMTSPETVSAVSPVSPVYLKGSNPRSESVRGVLRDALTLIDESGVFLSCSDAMWTALCERRWTDLFVKESAGWQAAQVHLVGHALLEKLLRPYKSITAQVLRVTRPGVSPGPVSHAQWDGAMKAALTEALSEAMQWPSPKPLGHKPFQVLPLMGIPGWDPGQGAPGYYEDTGVFRPASVPGLEIKVLKSKL